MRKGSIAGLALFLFLAGCLSPATDPAEPAQIATGRQALLDHLGSLPVPEPVGAAAVTKWEHFLATYPKRDWMLPHNTLASEFLAAELREAGITTEILQFPARVRGVDTPLSVRVVKGTVEGADLTHRVALVSHYDNFQSTTQAAYDDGAGTINELELCKLLQKQRAMLRRSVDCLFFDAEEEGLVASRAYAAWYNRTADRGFVYDLALGYDMTGINWPGHAWKLHAWIGTSRDELAPLNQPMTDFLNVALRDHFGTLVAGAGEGIEVHSDYRRSSDEIAFMNIGIPVIRFSGGLSATDYPAYHTPLDTTLYVYNFVGGRTNFEKGVEAVIWTSYYTILGIDPYELGALPTA